MTNQRDIRQGVSAKNIPRKNHEQSTGVHSPPSAASRTPIPTHNSSRKGSIELTGVTGIQTEILKRRTECNAGGILCALYVHEDCRINVRTEHEGTGEDALFCTLCNSEVFNLYFPQGIRVNNLSCQFQALKYKLHRRIQNSEVLECMEEFSDNQHLGNPHISTQNTMTNQVLSQGATLTTIPCLELIRNSRRKPS